MVCVNPCWYSGNAPKHQFMMTGTAALAPIISDVHFSAGAKSCDLIPGAPSHIMWEMAARVNS